MSVATKESIRARFIHNGNQNYIFIVQSSWNKKTKELLAKAWNQVRINDGREAVDPTELIEGWKGKKIEIRDVITQNYIHNLTGEHINRMCVSYIHGNVSCEAKNCYYI